MAGLAGGPGRSFVAACVNHCGKAGAAASVAGGGLVLVFGNIGARDRDCASRDADHGGSLYLRSAAGAFHYCELGRGRIGSVLEVAGICALACSNPGIDWLHGRNRAPSWLLEGQRNAFPTDDRGDKE